MSASAPVIAGIFTIVLWSVTSAVLALTAPVPPFLVGAVSFLSAYAVIAGFWVSRGENILKKFRMPLKCYLLGLCGMFIYNPIYIYAFKAGPSLEVNLLNYLWPAVLVFVSFLVQKKKPSISTVCGMLLCVTGSFFVFESRGALDLGGGHFTLWLGLLCAVLWGGYSALSKYAGVGSDQIGVFLLITGLVMLALHLMFEETLWPVSLQGWLMLGIYAIARLCFFSWDYALKRGGVEVIASLSYFIPLFSTLSLAAVDKTTFSSLLLFGAALIISGCLVVNFKSLFRGYAVSRARRGA